MRNNQSPERFRFIRNAGLAVTLLSATAWLSGCATNAQTSALIGTGVGVLAGQAIGGDTEGTLIGGAVGAGAGYIIGNEIDKQEDRNAAQARQRRSEKSSASNGSYDDGY